ncbi:uracil-xanthine permease family protein [Laribacter hongkongensis]|uniref:uracil-xanthine permease family protein n=1 Tax=Laribacter hongkongensis TaxID=168471 RepID=UPI001EFE4979|nr:uracil-xanthine permease family protein [Laribacter hongkongensis]MCG8995888.1 uracil-xanthine permease family protein [Laribacter hongkongensis]MCG9011356.1 uracil-xanthine permease family protein [Laribacter hongkongensis]MCG9023226.1 uracil-xanthine permease family protein [Laribacter hongkongensis]MCG9047918.1 uracil-xanthine permease family protein [Laribacter hongkongensis]MCG9074873.1 uracil-xanthine permease family protein [Laribacter hongkongensis]
MLNHLKQAVAGAQILFVAFGALVLVPLLTGLNPAMALLGAGIGTLLFQLCTGRKVPIFLGSSFAFIAPIIYATQTWGLPSTMFGLFAAGFMYFVFAALVRWRGMDAVNKLLPPVVIGPVIMIIGLSVATVASSMAMGRTGGEQVIPYTDALLLAAVSLATTVMVSIFARGMFRLVPILAGVIVGYVVAAFMGLVDFGKIANAPWFAVPHFVTPEVNWAAALFMLPVAIAPAIEHIGGVMAISGVTGKDYTKTPGLHRTLAGDGLGVCVAGLIGGPPVTTYAEVTGAVMITRNFNPVVMTWAAVFAICMAFFGKFNALLQSIPMPVMGGIMVLLFGTIASIGLKTLIEAKTDLIAPKNLVIVSVVLTAGIGALELKLGSFTLVGVGLCSILAIVLNWILPQGKNHDGIAEGQDV